MENCSEQQLNQGQILNCENGKTSHEASQWEIGGGWDTYNCQQGAWDGGTRGDWDQISNEGVSGHEEFENILSWDDSGAQEAFHIARERYEASLRGQIYPVSLPSPDLYIQVIDWEETYEELDVPESADTGKAGEEKKWERKRNRKGGWWPYKKRESSQHHLADSSNSTLKTSNKRSVYWDDHGYYNQRKYHPPVASDALFKAPPRASGRHFVREENAQLTHDSGGNFYPSCVWDNLKTNRLCQESKMLCEQAQTATGEVWKQPLLRPAAYTAGTHQQALPSTSGRHYSGLVSQERQFVYQSLARPEECRHSSDQHPGRNPWEGVASLSDNTIRRWGHHNMHQWHHNR